MDVKQIEKRIEQIKAELMQVGIMRPGSLSAQPRSRGCRYWQLSYTFQGKSCTEYVPEERKEETEKQVAAYRRFRELTQEWVQLSIQHEKIKRQQEKDRQ